MHVATRQPSSVLQANGRRGAVALVLLAAAIGLPRAGATTPEAPPAPHLGITPRDSLGANPTLADYLGYAVAHNDEIRAAQLARRAAGERRGQAASLPDPRLQYTEYLEPVQTRAGPQQRALALSQTVPWFGKLSLRGRIASEDAAAAAARLDATVLRVAFEIREAYHELAHLGRAIAVTEEHLELLRRWEEIARARYAAGNGRYADVIKAQVELGRISDRLAELRDRRRPLAAALDAVLGRSVAAVLPLPVAPPPEAPELDAAALHLRLREGNPELRALRHRSDAFLQAERLARRQKYPDLTLGISWIRTGPAPRQGVGGDGKDPILASLAVNLPIWRGKYRAAEREAAGNHLSSRATSRDRERALAADLENALFGYRDARRRLELHRDTLLPKGRQSLGATSAAYEAGEAGFLDLVDAQRLLLEFELARARAAADLMIRLAEIEMLVGDPPSAVVPY